jgi:amino acid transporter
MRCRKTDFHLGGKELVDSLVSTILLYLLAPFTPYLLVILILLIVKRNAIKEKLRNFFQEWKPSILPIGLFSILFIVTLFLWVAEINFALRYMGMATSPYVDSFYGGLARGAVVSGTIMAAIFLSVNIISCAGLIWCIRKRDSQRKDESSS